MSTNTTEDSPTKSEPEPKTDDDPDFDTDSETDELGDEQPRAQNNENERPDEHAPADPVADSDQESSLERAEQTAAPPSAEAGPSTPPTVFRAAIQGGEIKSLVKTLRALVDEARFHIDEAKLTIRTIDPANVAMDDLELTAAAFESYEATAGLLGVNLERLASIVKLANKGDLVQFAFDAESRKLQIHIDGVEFTMACIDPDSIRREPEMPEMELPAQATLDQSALIRGMKAADMVSDHIAFEMDETEQCLLISAEGDVDDIRLTLDDSELDSPEFADAITLLSLDYVKDIMKTIPNGADVSIRFGTDFPMMLEYEFAEGDGHALRMVAPRIRNE
ncbi:DNA polymerase sliding clamp (plasmid) [Halorientalis pallida]|uniref:DNA polymerase sliding clamp n=1 Tax=Halorientalis pallida TaxID=2479928 RepID=UPI003C6FA8AE